MRGTILSTSSSSVVRWTVFLVATLTAPALVMGVHAVGLVGDISCLDRTIRDVAVLEGRSSSDVHLDGVKTIRGEFGSYLQLVVVERLGASNTGLKVSSWIVECQSGHLWRGSDFVDPVPYPWSKLDAHLREAAKTNSLPSRLVVAVYIRVTEQLLMGESVFVPNGLSPLIWNSLTDREKFVLQDYWKRYENVPGDPELSAQEHSVVVEKALALITAHNNNVTWPILRSLIQVLQTIPSVAILDPDLMTSAQSIRLEISPSDLGLLVNIPQVGYITQDRTSCYGSCFSLDVSVPTIGVNTVFWNAGYTGSGIKIGMLDTGVSSHPNLQLAASRGFGDDGSTNDCASYGGHGTAVAGVIRSDHSTYRGVAYSSSLYNAKVMNADCTTSDTIVKNGAYWLTDTNSVGIITSSMNPEGQVDDNGGSAMAMILDYIVASRAVLLTQSVGNDGGYVNIPSAAYNIVSVGASQDQNTVTRTDDIVWPSSSRGVTGSSRGKPDVIAPGVSIVSTDTFQSFESFSGTSFAAPHVAGLAALLKQAYPNADYLELKARLINGDYFLRNHPWQSSWAWSYIDAYWSYWSNLVWSGSVGNHVSWTTQVYLPASYTSTYTLVWNREMTSESQIKGTSDLDLSVTCPNGQTDSSASSVDNVERIQLVSYPGQFCSLTVYGANVPASIGTQTFRIVEYRV